MSSYLMFSSKYRVLFFLVKYFGLFAKDAEHLLMNLHQDTWKFWFCLPASSVIPFFC